MYLSQSDIDEVFDEELGFSKYYTKNGNLMVLLSTDYGSGWSTSCYDAKESVQLLMDSRIIRFFLDTYDEDYNKRRDERPMKTFFKVNKRKEN